MLSARWHKVLHDVLGSKTRTVLIVLSMAVGLFAVGLILSARSILSEGLAQSFAAINPSSGTVRTMQLFDEDFVRSVSGMRDVTAADARRNVPARAESAPGTWKNITLFVVSDYDDMRVNKVTSQEGAWPPPEREILIERAAMQVLGSRIGDTLKIKLPNDAERQMRIAGTTYDPAQMPAQLDGTPYGYITFETLEWFGEPYGFNELHVVATHPENKSWAEQVVNRVKDKAERSGYTIPMSMTADPGQLPMDDVLEGIMLLMGILGVLSLFLSGFLVVNTISALLAQQKRQIGMMKAVGGSTLQIFGMYLVMVVSYGIMALLIAIPLGLVGARPLSRNLAAYLNFDLASMEVQPQAIWLQMLIGLVLPIIASLLPFLANLRISAAEAMSAYTMGTRRYSTSWIRWLISGQNLWFMRGMPVRPVLLAVRNMFRNQGRLALTLITLTLSSATFVSVFNVRASLTSTVDDMMSWFDCDAMLMLERAYRAERIEQEALRMPSVVETDIWLQMPTRRVRPDGTEGPMIYMFAPTISESSLIHSPAIVEGRWLLADDQNAIVVPSVMFQDEPDLQLGGEEVLKIYGEERSFRIVGTYVGTSYAAMIFANYQYMARVTDRVGETDALLVRTVSHDPAAVEGWTNGLERHLHELGVQVGMVATIQKERTEAEAIFDVIVALLVVMAVLLALVGGLGLMGTMSINVLERTREIGVLRAIGAPNRGVAGVFICEGIAVGLLSWLMGAGIAIPMTRALNQAVGGAVLGMPLTYSYSVPGLGLWLFVVLLLSTLASFVPARNATRLTVREVLAYE